MLKLINMKRCLAANMMIAFALMFVFSNIVMGQADPFYEMQKGLDRVSHKEKEILQDLFILVQEIDMAEEEQEGIAQEIDAINIEISDLEAAIEEEEKAYAQKQEGLKQILKSYQRMGPVSYIEIILNSDSLSSFLRRINILRDLARDTGKLLEQLEASQERLLKSKEELIHKLGYLEGKQKQSKEALAKKAELKSQLEKYLESLAEEREHYETQLSDMQTAWKELKSVFSDIVSNFSAIINDDCIPTDAIKMSFSMSGVKGSLKEQTLNNIVSKQDGLERMEFDFKPGEVEIKLPEKNLILSGTFTVIDGCKLKFQAEGGSFYAMPLETGSIEDLFADNQMELDIKPYLGGNTLQSAEILEGTLELIIKFSFFSSSLGGDVYD